MYCHTCWNLHVHIHMYVMYVACPWRSPCWPLHLTCTCISTSIAAQDDDGILDSTELESQTAALPESHAAAIKERMHTLRSTIRWARSQLLCVYVHVHVQCSCRPVWLLIFEKMCLFHGRMHYIDLILVVIMVPSLVTAILATKVVLEPAAIRWSIEYTWKWIYAIMLKLSYVKCWCKIRWLRDCLCFSKKNQYKLVVLTINVLEFLLTLLPHLLKTSQSCFLNHIASLL